MPPKLDTSHTGIALNTCYILPFYRPSCSNYEVHQYKHRSLSQKNVTKSFFYNYQDRLVINFLKYFKKIIFKLKTLRLDLLASLMFTLVVLLYPTDALAENTTTITPINDEISLKKTVIPMNIPKDNIFPWGAVRGQASEFAERYPVIIQIFKGEDPVHFAQVDLKGDGSLEYKFRIRDVDANTGEATNIFEWQYTVNIYKASKTSNS